MLPEIAYKPPTEGRQPKPKNGAVTGDEPKALDLEPLVLKWLAAQEKTRTEMGIANWRERVTCPTLSERGVQHTSTPPYHPQAKSVERANRTLRTMIASYLRE